MRDQDAGRGMRDAVYVRCGDERCGCGMLSDVGREIDERTAVQMMVWGRNNQSVWTIDIKLIYDRN